MAYVLRAGLSDPRPALHFLQYNRQGATAARNAGAGASQGQVLVFLDDDIWPEPAAVETLVRDCLANDRTVMFGTLLTPAANQRSVFARLNAPSPLAAQAAAEDRELAATVVFLAGAGAGYITGQVLPVDGGMTIT